MLEISEFSFADLLDGSICRLCLLNERLFCEWLEFECKVELLLEVCSETFDIVAPNILLKMRILCLQFFKGAEWVINHLGRHIEVFDCTGGKLELEISKQAL